MVREEEDAVDVGSAVAALGDETLGEMIFFLGNVGGLQPADQPAVFCAAEVRDRRLIDA